MLLTNHALYTFPLFWKCKIYNNPDGCPAQITRWKYDFFGCCATKEIAIFRHWHRFLAIKKAYSKSQFTILGFASEGNLRTIWAILYILAIVRNILFVHRWRENTHIQIALWPGNTCFLAADKKNKFRFLKLHRFFFIWTYPGSFTSAINFFFKY